MLFRFCLFPHSRLNTPLRELLPFRPMIRTMPFPEHNPAMPRASSRARTAFLDMLASLPGPELAIGLAVLLALLMGG